MMSRTGWIVKTPEGFLGQRRHNYRGDQPERRTQFRFARVFTREGDAHKACHPGDEVLEAKISVEC